jgi:hypothetical protein
MERGHKELVEHLIFPKAAMISIVTFDEASTKLVGTDAMMNTVIPERKFLER